MWPMHLIHPTVKHTFLCINNVIYMGEHMNDCFVNPIQCMEAGTLIDLRPKNFFGNHDTAQTLQLSNGCLIPILHDGPLPFIYVRRPTYHELQ